MEQIKVVMPDADIDNWKTECKTRAILVCR